MAALTFLQAVLPSEGNTYITVEKTSTGQMRHYTHETLTEAQEKLSHIINRRHDAYVAIGSFTGKKRTTKDVASKRAWYIDIDCKEGGQYNTKTEAIAALQQAVAKGLPQYSFIVDSGNGYHIYWVTTQDVSEADWKPVNNALINACKKCGLEIDVAVTQDIARILRAPDSLNYKDPSDPRPCKLVPVKKGTTYTYDQIKAVFEPYVHSLKLAVDNSAVDNSDLYGGMENAQEGRKPLASEMIPLCPVFSASIANGGADDAEPLWHQLLYTLSFCEDGAQYIHSVSSGHKSYVHRETEFRFNRYKQDRDDPNNNFGPTTCEKFSTLSDKCASCEFKPKQLFKSPIKLGFGAPSELPWPFRNGQHGLEKLEDEDTGYMPVMRYKVESLELLRDQKGEVYGTVEIDKRPITTILGVFTDKAGQKILADRGILLADYEFREFKELMVAWTKQLASTGSIKAVTGRQFGWNESNGFVYAGTIHKKGGDNVPARGADPLLVNMYSPTGEFEPWRKCAQHILDHHHPANWVMLASAFSAPLIKFAGVASVIVSNVTAGSGTSKSTRMQIAQGVWGNPVKGIFSLDDTANAISHRLGTLGTLPAYWDEVREKENAIAIIKLMFRVMQGKDKGRLSQKVEERIAGDWQTILSIATNEPLRDHITQNIENSDAGSQRLFEIENYAAPKDNMSNSEARRMFGALRDNYGHAGLMFVEWLVNNFDEAKKIFHTIDDKFVQLLQSKNEERFNIATIAALLAGATICHKAGILKWDLKAFRDYLIKAFREQRKIKQETDVSTHASRATDLVARYIHDKAEHMVRADQRSVRGNAGNVLVDAQRRPVLGRICHNENVVLISKKEFTDWMYKRSGSGYSRVLDELLDLEGVSQIRSTLDGGSPMASGVRHYVLELNLNSPALTDLEELAGAELADNRDLTSS